MKTLIVCKSVSHGNTRKVADVMASELAAQVLTPEEVDPATLGEYELVGFGSGIYNMTFRLELRELIRTMPSQRGTKAFVYCTSGFPDPPFRRYIPSLGRSLEDKGLSVVDTFSCRAFDTSPPLKLLGGVRKGRPDAGDLQAARAFAQGLRTRIATTS